MRPQGRPDMVRMAAGQPAKPNFFQDMFNGGGMGATGDTFKGAGGYSGLLNMLGVSPMGAQDRGTLSSYAQALQAASQPQAPSQAPYTAQPAPTGYEGAGMPLQYSGRSSVGMPLQYSGRSSVGMPYPEWAQGQLPEWGPVQQFRGVLDYLRPNGVSGY